MVGLGTQPFAQRQFSTRHRVINRKELVARCSFLLQLQCRTIGSWRYCSNKWQGAGFRQNILASGGNWSMKEIANFEYDLAALPEMGVTGNEILKQRNIVLFIGGGCRKDHTYQGVCSQLQVSDEVSVPTYALVNDYRSASDPLSHGFISTQFPQRIFGSRYYGIPWVREHLFC